MKTPWLLSALLFCVACSESKIIPLSDENADESTEEVTDGAPPEDTAPNADGGSPGPDDTGEAQTMAKAISSNRVFMAFSCFCWFTDKSKLSVRFWCSSTKKFHNHLYFIKGIKNKDLKIFKCAF